MTPARGPHKLGVAEAGRSIIGLTKNNTFFAFSQREKEGDARPLPFR